MRIVSRAAIVLSLPLLALTSTGCDIVTADFRHQATEEWRKTYDLNPGGRVEIANVNGAIRVRDAEGNQVEIVAEKKARGASDEAAKDALGRIEIKEDVSPSAVRVETRLQRSQGLFGGGSGEVTYTVRVPNGAEVKFTTVNGGIEVARLAGRIHVETTNGGITARDVAGPIEATTTNGGVDVDLTRIDERGARLECTNGGIKLRLPPDAKATISASVANGGIDTNGLPLDTTESSRRRLEARLNGGGPAIRIEGTNGGIRINAR